MSRKFWRVSPFNKQQAAHLAYEYGYDEFAVLLLNARGVSEPEAVAEFFEEPPELSDPFLIKDMDKAVARIEKALTNNEKIVIYGDYDADGVTATALLYLYLETMGANAAYYIPSRTEEGYGMHKESLLRLRDEGAELIITVDNGINSVEETEYIKSLGMDIVITDHHQPGDELPRAAAVVNPHRADDTSPFKDFAGVGVAFKLAAALEGGDCRSILDDFGDIIAIGTIADIVPLNGENRTLAIEGIEAVNSRPRPGVAALKAAAGYSEKEFNSGNVAFNIAPRINAAGRLASALTALRLLLTEDEDEAAALASELDALNAHRQAQEAEIVAQVIERVERDPALKYARVLVVDGEGWHAGIIGIVASKLVERYGKPAMVISKDSSGEAKGSCRSISGFSLFEALTDAKDYLVRFGGHTLAAGFTVRDELIPKFRQRVNDYAASLPLFYPTLDLDCRINPQSVTMELIDSLELLEPFGAQNPQPLFGIYRVSLAASRPVGATGKHLRLNLEKNGCRFSAVFFGTSPEEFPYSPGDVIDLAVTVDKNEFKGETKANIYVKAVRSSDSNDEEYFKARSLYEKIKGGSDLTEGERMAACPDRSLAAGVFRYIKNQPGGLTDSELIALKLGLGSGGVCRVQILLDAFCELGLAENIHGRVRVSDTSKKVSLVSSSLLKSLGYRE